MRPPVSLAEQDRLPHGDTRAAGVVLSRRESGASAAKSLDLLIFLSGIGALRAEAPGGASGRRFGGGTEPMVWGEFVVYQGRRKIVVRSVDVREDFLAVRRSRAALREAAEWHALAARRLAPFSQDDRLLSLLFGSMKHLAAGAPPSAAGVRFLWRWANIWGTAPSMASCASCGRDLLTDDAPSTLSRDGALCASCARGGTHGSSIAPGILRAAHSCATSAPKIFIASPPQIAPPDAAALKSWLVSFL